MWGRGPSAWKPRGQNRGLGALGRGRKGTKARCEAIPRAGSDSPKEELGGELVAGTPQRKNGTEMVVGRKPAMRCPVATAFKLSMLNDRPPSLPSLLIYQIGYFESF